MISLQLMTLSLDFVYPFMKPCHISTSIISSIIHAPPLGPLWPLALFTVARPLANPTPRPRVPLDRNIGAFLKRSVRWTFTSLPK